MATELCWDLGKFNIRYCTCISTQFFTQKLVTIFCWFNCQDIHNGNRILPK